MTLEPSFLKLILCPKSRQKLNRVSQKVLASINEAIAKGSLENVKGVSVTDPIDDALVTADGALAYPVRHGIPHLIIEEGIDLTSNLKP